MLHSFPTRRSSDLTTLYEKIFIAPPLDYDFELLAEYLAELAEAAETGMDEQIYAIFTRMEIGFQPGNPPSGAATSRQPAEKLILKV